MVRQGDVSCATGAQGLAFLREPAFEMHGLGGAVSQDGRGGGVVGVQKRLVGVFRIHGTPACNAGEGGGTVSKSGRMELPSYAARRGVRVKQ